MTGSFARHSNFTTDRSRVPGRRIGGKRIGGTKPSDPLMPSHGSRFERVGNAIVTREGTRPTAGRGKGSYRVERGYIE